MTHKSEAAFGKDVFDKELRAIGYDVHNIQTPTTERGCPDRYIQKGTFSGWVELKNMRTEVAGRQFKIDYREGQQAWLHVHHQKGGLGFTMIATADGYLIIFNDRVYKDKIYNWEESPQLFMTHFYARTLSDWLQRYRPGMSNQELSNVRW